MQFAFRTGHFIHAFHRFLIAAKPLCAGVVLVLTNRLRRYNNRFPGYPSNQATENQAVNGIQCVPVKKT
jgi:hypothetical protein